VIELMERDDTNGEVFNIGNPQEVSIIDLARRILELTGSHSEIRHVPYEEVYGPDFEDLDRRVPDVTKLAGTIDWSALQDLDAILRAVIETERGKL